MVQVKILSKPARAGYGGQLVFDVEIIDAPHNKAHLIGMNVRGMTKNAAQIRGARVGETRLTGEYKTADKKVHDIKWMHIGVAQSHR